MMETSVGCFDRVEATCPKCGHSVEFQSKVGDCAMTTYTLEDVPGNIAADIIGESVWCDCGYYVTIQGKVVPMLRVE